MDNRIQEKLRSFERLLNIMDELREKCPWDKKQTFDSLRTLTIEETYELADAMLSKNTAEIKKELGDLLLHIVFYSKIGSETNDFDIKDVCDALCAKLIYRHPHIFADVNVENATQVEENWEQLKLKEKGGNKTVLAGVPNSLPALIKAHRIQDKARSVGFDWEKREDVWNKVKEEIAEFETEVNNENNADMEKEFGDLLFSMVNVARLYGINPENALEKTNQKFIQRFNYIENQTIQKGIQLKELSLKEMDAIWDEAKKHETPEK